MISLLLPSLMALYSKWKKWMLIQILYTMEAGGDRLTLASQPHPLVFLTEEADTDSDPLNSGKSGDDFAIASQPHGLVFQMEKVDANSNPLYDGRSGW